MLLNCHSYYSLRYGTLSIENLVVKCKEQGYDSIVLTDINNTTGALEFVKTAGEKGIQAVPGMEFRNGDEILYIGIARNNAGFRELNELLTNCTMSGKHLPKRAPAFDNCYVLYIKDSITINELRDNEFIGIAPRHLNKLIREPKRNLSKYVIHQSVVFEHEKGYNLHCQLCAINHNVLFSQLQTGNTAHSDEHLIPKQKLLKYYEQYPEIIRNTEKLISECNFSFDFTTVKNRKTFTGSRYDDKLLLEKLAHDGMIYRYGKSNTEAYSRVKKELEIIDNLGFSAYFLIANDIVHYSMHRGFYHVGRGSGANSVVAYCLKITDVCPIELDLYFERFLNPKRKSPPDFDIDYSWKERDQVFDYIFKRYGSKHTALLGAMSTFKDRSIIRELGKVYGLPKGEIDRLVDNPNNPLNKHEISRLIMSVYSLIEDFPNIRSIHAGGVLISEEPITAYCAMDLPPKGFPTVQFDMYIAEDIGLDKLDILSQRGIGHIKEAADIIYKNKGIKVDVHDVNTFKKDIKINQQLKSGDSIGCFYIESPAMRGLLKKLHCEDYITLVAASSIIRPGVAKSGMMREYISRFHKPDSFKYLHPVMEEQLKETFGVMVFQEDVLKVCHHFAGLDLADADVLRRMMSGKGKSKKQLQELKQKFFDNCKELERPDDIAQEVWRQVESFAGYSFSKAHSASYAVESYQSLYLKTYYPLEFMTAVINNFGGFYATRVYVNEAKKAGAHVNLPCVNNSLYFTTICGIEIFLGFIHIQNLESDIAQNISVERDTNGPYNSLDNFIDRTNISLEQLIILIRIDALRFTGKNKKELLWEAHTILGGRKITHTQSVLFNSTVTKYTLPELTSSPVEDIYDELELLGFIVTKSWFDLLKTSQRIEIKTKDLMSHVGKTIKLMGTYVARKMVPTVRNETMAFGTFIDAEGEFFDTTHFPNTLSKYPFSGVGVYLIMGKVVEEFGFPSIEVDKMAMLPVLADPRAI